MKRFGSATEQTIQGKINSHFSIILRKVKLFNHWRMVSMGMTMMYRTNQKFLDSSNLGLGLRKGLFLFVFVHLI